MIDTRGPDLNRLTVHLAHHRADVASLTGIRPGMNPAWVLLLPLAPHRWRCAAGWRDADGATLYVIPPGFGYALDLPRYRQFSANFSDGVHRGWREASRRRRAVPSGDWMSAPMRENPETLRLGDASWRLVNPLGRRDDVLVAFGRLVAAYQRGDRFRMLAALLQSLERVVPPMRNEDDARLRAFADHLAFRGSHAASVAELARACGISRSYLHQLCLRTYGASPKELLLRERLALACGELERGGSVRQAAGVAGFGDEFYFSRLFRSRQGMPPSRWATRPR